MRKKLLFSAYAISPVRGSEYGAAWNMVTNLAKEHDLWVLYGMSDDHMGDTQTLKAYLREKPVPSVTFVEIRAGWLATTINRLNKAGLGWFFYFAYYLWQKKAYKAAKQLIKEVNIDVMHQFGPIGFREPGFLGRLDKPLVWGPVGGMNIISKELLQNKPFTTGLKFGVKNIINHIQLNYSPRIRQAFQRADVVIAATKTGQQTIREKFGRESYYLPEQGAINTINLNEIKFNTIQEQVQMVWCGTHIERKNLELCLDAFSMVKQKNWHLHVLGSGPLTPVLVAKAEAMGLTAHITWHGHISRQNAFSIMNNAHLHIITSIAEDNPAVIFEALSAGVPTLTPAHCGMDDVICNHCGIKVAPGEPGRMTRRVAIAIDELLSDPIKLKQMAAETLKCASNHSWDKRLAKLDSFYDEAIALHRRPASYVAEERPLTILQDA